MTGHGVEMHKGIADVSHGRADDRRMPLTVSHQAYFVGVIVSLLGICMVGVKCTDDSSPDKVGDGSLQRQCLNVDVV
jgi:hypothetical protein